MNLFLDTRVLLWVLTDERSISKAARSAIEHPGNQVFVNAATAWEIAIKRGLGKLRAPQDYLESLELYRFTPLDISSEHALAVEHLPKHHNDPNEQRQPYPVGVARLVEVATQYGSSWITAFSARLARLSASLRGIYLHDRLLQPHP